LVKWPMRTTEDNGQLLFSALRQLRACVKKLMEQQFTLEHVQPLVELCMTIRLKCLSKLVETTRTGIISLGNKENWKTEVMDSAPECFVKTNLPDFYENELIEALPNMQQILAHDGFRGELDLFSRDKFKEMLLDLFELLLTSVKECVEQLLQLHGQRSSTSAPSALQQMNRPMSFESKEQALTGRKLLITVCNLEYIIRCSLARLCRRLSDCGIKYADVILQRSKQKLQSFRSTLIRSYISMKCRQFSALIENASYEGYVPDDVSDYVKEVVMCVVFIQAEIYLVSPQLIVQIMNAVIRGAMDSLMTFLRTVPVVDEDHATQMAIDISAFEESLHSYFTEEMRGVANALRADLLSKIEQKRFQRSLQSYRTGMRMAIDSLQHFASSSSSSNDNASSNI